MSAWEKSRASEKKSCQQKKVAPAKKKSRQQKYSRASEKKSRQQKKVAPAKKSRASKKSRATEKEVSPQVRKCAPKCDAHMYDAVRTHVWCCTHTCMALTRLRIRTSLHFESARRLWSVLGVCFIWEILLPLKSADRPPPRFFLPFTKAIASK